MQITSQVELPVCINTVLNPTLPASTTSLEKMIFQIRNSANIQKIILIIIILIVIIIIGVSLNMNIHPVIQTIKQIIIIAVTTNKITITTNLTAALIIILIIIKFIIKIITITLLIIAKVQINKILWQHLIIMINKFLIINNMSEREPIMIIIAIINHHKSNNKNFLQEVFLLPPTHPTPLKASKSKLNIITKKTVAIMSTLNTLKYIKISILVLTKLIIISILKVAKIPFHPKPAVKIHIKAVVVAVMNASVNMMKVQVFNKSNVKTSIKLIKKLLLKIIITHIIIIIVITIIILKKRIIIMKMLDILIIKLDKL